VYFHTLKNLQNYNSDVGTNIFEKAAIVCTSAFLNQGSHHHTCHWFPSWVVPRWN